MKRVLILLLAVCMIAGGCSQLPAESKQKQYTATFLSLFDTVTTIVGKADSEEDF